MLQFNNDTGLGEDWLLMDHDNQQREAEFMTPKPQSSEVIIPCHPLGIKPLGNLYMARRNIKEAAGLFYSIPDDLLIQILEFLEPLPLLQLGATCKALWAFSRQEDLWRTRYVEYVSFWDCLITEFNENIALVGSFLP